MSLPPRGPVHLVMTCRERQCEKFELRPLTAAVVRASAFYKASLQVERRKKASCLSSAGRSRKAKRSASEKYRSAISLVRKSRQIFSIGSPTLPPRAKPSNACPARGDATNQLALHRRAIRREGCILGIVGRPSTRRRQQCTTSSLAFCVRYLR